MIFPLDFWLTIGFPKDFVLADEFFCSCFIFLLCGDFIRFGRRRFALSAIYISFF